MTDSGIRHVLTALSGSDEARLVGELNSLPEVRIARRCADLVDLLAVAATGLGDLAVLSAELRGLDRESLARLNAHGVSVLGVFAEGDEDQERRLRQLGVHLTLPATADRQRLSEVVGSVPILRPHVVVDPLARLGGGALGPVPAHLEREVSAWAPEAAGGFTGGGAPPIDGPLIVDVPVIPDSEESRPGRLITVWGPTGAPGRTAVAVNLAAELAALGERVLLVDADTYGGSVAQTLAILDDVPGLLAAARAADSGRLDLPSLARLAPTVATGFRVLTGMNDPSRWPEVGEAAWLEVIAQSRLLADYVIVDAGFCLEEDEALSYDTRAPRRNGTTVTAVHEADQIVAVGSADPVGLQRMVRALGALAEITPAQPTVVINRARDAAVGKPAARVVRDALLRFAGVGEVIVIPDDRPAFDECLMRGRVLAEVARRSPARVGIQEIVGRVSTRAPARASRGRGQ